MKEKCARQLYALNAVKQRNEESNGIKYKPTMTKKEVIKIFEEKKVRTVWDDETEEWYFSIVYVVSVLTDSVDPAAYWRN